MPDPVATARIVLTTTASREEAERLAHTLVEEHLAACVTLLPGAESIYRWQGEVESSAETMMAIKTSVELVPALETRLHALHSYRTPEFLVLKVEAGSRAYLHWMEGDLRKV
jgi:periplasmic divalent cation tolerance protein